MKPLLQELKDRGLFFQWTDEKALEKYDNWWEKFYCGFDPTADSLHLGNFIGFMVAIHIMRRWNTYIALTGWATGMIWDPGGKDAERTFLDEETLQNNQQAISKQMENIATILEKNNWETYSIEFVNNKDFYINMWYLDFLREIGKFITINTMISKDTVKKRVEDPKQSISYTEFSYALLQWYDFCKLFNDSDVKMQIGGQDQWGNLVTGTELIRKKYDKKADIFTWPLITDATGRKFGKSEGNALWLDRNKTSAYELYQYFMNTADNDIERYLKMLTLIEIEQIDTIVAWHLENPEQRAGQICLAFEVVAIIHGHEQAQLAVKITEFLFGSPHSISPNGREEGSKIEILKNLSHEELLTFQKSIWWFDYTWENLFESIVKSELALSNWEARKSVQSWAISINSEKISEFEYDFSTNFINDSFILLQKWKKNFRLILK